jgi:putative RecB family exonuclease
MSTVTVPSQTIERRSGVWDYLSPSRLNLWLRCPLAFKLKYVDGIEPATTPSLFVGKRVHEALEVHYRHRQIGNDLDAHEVVRRVGETWDAAANTEDRLQFESVEEEQQLKHQTAALVQTYLAYVGDQEPKPLAVETSLQAPLIDPCTGQDLGLPLTGIVDLILDDPAGPRICDFKTANKSTALLEVTHEIQLSCYAYLYRQTTGASEGGLEIRSLVKTKTPKIEFHHYAARNDKQFRCLFAVIRAPDVAGPPP